MKATRRKAREDALKILYQLDLNHGLTPQLGLDHFGAFFARSEEPLDEFTRSLVQGVVEKLEDIDKLLAGVAENWRLDRMAVVDRNLLRLGVFELHYCDDIPTTVSINEMIELAKVFGSESSAAFINGILDRIGAAVQRPEKAP